MLYDFAYPILSKFVSLVGAGLLHGASVNLLLLFVDFREREIGDIKYTLSLRNKRSVLADQGRVYTAIASPPGENSRDLWHRRIREWS